MRIAKTYLKDKRLYKFRSIAKDCKDPSKPDPKKLHYIERIFSQNELYFPSPIELNDPLECRPLFICGCFNDPKYKKRYVKWAKRIMIAGGNNADPGAIQDWLENLTQEQADLLTKDQLDHTRQELAKYRICSFSSKMDNPVVWSHYADEHRGFCLVFNADNDFFGSALKVEYQNEYPTLDVTEQNDFEILKNSVLVKYSDWSYEDEYRLVSSEPNYKNALPVKNKKLNFPKVMLIGLIYGYKMNASDRKVLKELIKKYNWKIKEKEAVLSENKFTLTIKDI